MILKPPKIPATPTVHILPTKYIVNQKSTGKTGLTPSMLGKMLVLIGSPTRHITQPTALQNINTSFTVYRSGCHIRQILSRSSSIPKTILTPPYTTQELLKVAIKNIPKKTSTQKLAQARIPKTGQISAI